MKPIVRNIIVIAMLLLISLTPALAAGQSPVVTGVTNQPSGEIIAASPGATTPASHPILSNTVPYTIDRLGMTVKIPDNLYVFTRKVAQDDPNLAVFGLKREWLLGYFTKYDVYLNAVAAQVTYEINITVANNAQALSILDFNLLSVDALKSFTDNSKNIYQIAGALYDGGTTQYTTSDVYSENKQAKFIRSEFVHADNNGNKSSGVQYFTIYGGKAINFIMSCYVQSLMPECYSIMSDMINSAAFAETSMPLATPSAAPLTTPLESIAVQRNYINETPLLLVIAAYLVVTFVLFTLPILIYRFALKRQPLSNEKAKKVALLDGLVLGILVVAYIIYSGIFYIAAGIILWSIVNYFVLKCPKRVKADDSTDEIFPVIPDPVQKEKHVTTMTVNKTCKNCFAVNLASSKVCFYCGAAMDDNPEDEDEFPFKC